MKTLKNKVEEMGLFNIIFYTAMGSIPTTALLSTILMLIF